MEMAVNDHAAAYYPVDDKLRMPRQKLKIRRAKKMMRIDDAAAAPSPYLPEEMNIEADAVPAPAPYLPEEMNIDAAPAPAPAHYLPGELVTPRQKLKIRRVKKKMKIDDAAAQPYLPEEEMNIDADAAPSPYLPEELVIANILTRLPFRTLAQYSCVSKLCYNSISNDAQFAKAHYAHNKNHRKLNLVFVLLNVWTFKGGAAFFSLDDDYKFRISMNVKTQTRAELVGYCNGLACITLVHKYGSGRNYVNIINPIRKEILTFPYNYPNDDGGECEYLCHGFGFDSSTDEYKVVIIFTFKGIEEYFISMVFTLGTRSWRKIITSVAQISPPPGCSPFPPSRLVTRRAATLCGGDLFWKISANSDHHTEEVRDNNNRIGMLLSFDIHKEKIQFIRLPAEYDLTAPTPTTMNVVVEHHLLEHKGYACVAQSEKAMACRSPDGQSSFCCGCCCFTVQLYLLKDKEKQVWIKGGTFSVKVKDLGPLPAPFCCYFDTTTTATTARFPTQILSVSDQVLLHWFDGKCFQIYNLQTKHVDVVGSSSSCDKRSRLLFVVKTCGFPPFNGIDNDGYGYPLYADCQLDAQAESILSLRTFIPAGGETRRYYDTKVPKYQKDNPPAGWLSTQRESVNCCLAFC